MITNSDTAHWQKKENIRNAIGVLQTLQARIAKADPSPLPFDDDFWFVNLPDRSPKTTIAKLAQSIFWDGRNLFRNSKALAKREHGEQTPATPWQKLRQLDEGQVDN